MAFMSERSMPERQLMRRDLAGRIGGRRRANLVEEQESGEAQGTGYEMQRDGAMMLY